MSGSSRTKIWQWLLPLLLLLIMTAAGGLFLLSSGLISFNLPFASPSATIVMIDQFAALPATFTPFQPLPTSTTTPTFTPTPTATATPTRTPKPTKTATPIPSDTPVIPTVEGLPSSYVISGIYGYNQSHSLSCESRSSVDWANFFGVSIGENEFQSALPRSDNPDAGFVGNPDGTEGQIPPNSYGVHADPVAALLRSYGLSAKAVHGFSFDDLRRQIASGKPVITWVYGNVWAGGIPVSYQALDGHTTMVVAFEHTVIIYGYDDSSVWVLDGGMTYTRPNWIFEDSWGTLGNMAVVMK